jgi:hypothetical protein
LKLHGVTPGVDRLFDQSDRVAEVAVVVDADLSGDVHLVARADRAVPKRARRAFQEPNLACHHASHMRLVEAFIPSLFMISTVGRGNG